MHIVCGDSGKVHQISRVKVMVSNMRGIQYFQTNVASCGHME
jgi:hypothetical protein